MNSKDKDRTDQRRLANFMHSFHAFVALQHLNLLQAVNNFFIRYEVSSDGSMTSIHTK